MKSCAPLTVILALIFSSSANAQIIPDSTVGSIVVPGVLSDKIDGGAVRGNNLFHSFSEFNVDSGRGVYFTNPTDVTNIFTRVTGVNSSNINGTLGVLIQLNQGANLRGDVTVGSQGNINIDTQTLIMLGASNITTNASLDANGGNITINAAAIAQLENSNITANAVKGSGGNIQITTQGLFKSEDSNIIAASERGISGTTNITTQKTRQDNSLQQQPSNFIDTNQAIATSCLARNNANQGRFVVTGNGGLPNIPSNHVDLDYSILSVNPVNITTTQNIQNTQTTWKLGDKIQEATQLVTTPSGRLLLSTNTDTQLPKTQTLTC